MRGTLIPAKNFGFEVFGTLAVIQNQIFLTEKSLKFEMDTENVDFHLTEFPQILTKNNSLLMMY